MARKQKDQDIAKMAAAYKDAPKWEGCVLRYEDGVPSYRATIDRMDLGPEWIVPDPSQTDQVNWPPK